MKHKKKSTIQKSILVLIFSVVVITIFSLGALAVRGNALEVTSLEKLDTSDYTVPLGTTLKEIPLPQSIGVFWKSVEMPIQSTREGISGKQDILESESSQENFYSKEPIQWIGTYNSNIPGVYTLRSEFSDSSITYSGKMPEIEIIVLDESLSNDSLFASDETLLESDITSSTPNQTTTAGLSNQAPTDISNNLIPTPEKRYDESLTNIQDGDIVKVGQVIPYKILYTNNHSTKPGTVTITDEIDIGLTVDESSISDGGVYDPTTRILTWVFEDVPPGFAGYVTYSATVNKDSLIAMKIENGARVEVIHGGDPEEDSDLEVPPLTNVLVKKTYTDTTPSGAGGSAVSVGDVIEYKITWKNSEYKSAPEKVTIVDTLDVGLTVDESSISNEGFYDSATHTIRWQFIAPSESEGYVSYRATVNEHALESGTVINKATVQLSDRPESETNTVENPVLEKKPEESSSGISSKENDPQYDGGILFPPENPHPPNTVFPSPPVTSSRPSISSESSYVPAKNPNTGDNSDFKFWVSVLVGTISITAALGGIALIIKSTKKQ